MAPDACIGLLTQWLDALSVENARERISESEARGDTELRDRAQPVTAHRAARAAFHEAAHAVIACRSGLDVSTVCIRIDGSGAAHYEDSQRTVGGLISTITAHLAGAAFELLTDRADEKRQWQLASSHDVAAARIDIDTVRAQGDDWNLPTRTFAGLGCCGVLSNWRAIWRAGHVLAASGELNGREVGVLCERAQ